MKILYASHLFLPKYYGGTEVYTYNIASEMKLRGHDVHVLACESFKTGKRNEVRAHDDVYGDLKVHRVFLNIMLMDDPVRAEYFNPYVERHLMDYYTKIRPDIIHAHHFGYLSTAVFTAARKLKIPTAFTATDFWLVCPNSQLLRWNNTLCEGPTNIADCLRCYTHLSNRAKKYRWLIKTLPDDILKRLVRAAVELGSKPIWQFRVLKAAGLRAEWNRNVFNSVGLFISPSNFLESMFIRNGLTNANRLHIPFGVRSPLLESNTRKTPSPVLRFGFIGTISKHKGVHILIEAFKELGKDEPVKLCVYGSLEFDPPYGTRIRQLAAGDSRIEFGGTFPHQNMGEILRQIDVLIVPSNWYENTPLVVYAALATETPVICSDLGGMAEIVLHGRNGLTFKAGSSQALCDRMREVLADRGLLDRLRPDRSTVQTVERNTDELERAYRNLLGRETATDPVKTLGAALAPH
ncbi:MAG: glycosyltransferase family 4 protein [Terriglobia bacterium]